MKKHYVTHVEDTDKLISVAGPILEYKSWYEQYRKLMEEQAQRKYGLYTPTSEGDEDDFPSIPGMIARYSALGLTNEQMATNPVWVDKTGNGHDLQMKNFAWGGTSGVGGYVDNWNSSADWAVNSYWVNSHTDHKLQFITASTVVQVKSKNVYNAENVYKNILNVNGLTEAVNKGAVSSLEIFVTDSITSKVIKIFSFETDGVIQISFDDVLQDYYVNYFVTGNNTNDIDITIEQLPLYPGALVFDGVDDYGVCDNFPILTKEKGYTVVALRQYLVEKSTAYLTANGDSISNTSFIFEGNNYKDTWNFGRVTTIQASRILATQTSKQYDGVKLNIGTNAEGSNLLQVGKWSKSYSNVAIWELVFLDHDATEEELTKIKDYFVKTYPWLFPDQAWTVTGKTNEDEDRATIANITGNGNNLVLSNFGFAKGSGYGLYNIQKFTNWNHVTDRGDIVKNGYSVTITNSKITGSSTNYNTDILYSYNSSSTTIIFKVTGLVDGQKIFLGRKSVADAYVIDKDGIYRSDYNIPQEDGKVIVGIGTVGFTGECNITIEQIPEYEGYLVTDGVDDRVQDSSFKLNKDWTLVGEWVLLNQKATNAGITKPFSFIVYNRTTGLSLFINTGTSGITIENVKSIKAICSDGRIYLDDWSEMLISKDQDITSSTSVLSIGFNGTAYTQIAFKNLGIYNNQILSKEDCIKAYNYLQTLKAK